MTKFSKIIFSIISLLLIVSLFFALNKKKAEAPVQIKIEENKKDIFSEVEVEKQTIIEESKKTEEIKIPNKVLISAPFTSQAPFGKWDEYHEEACEEASLLMVQYFLQNKKLTKEIAESEIQKMIAYQIKNYGDYRDSSAEELVKLASDFYKLDNLKVIYDFSQNDLKKELAKNNPIIIPAAGRLLGNPNFTPPGPLYHNLVLVGYDGDMIIVNDPGTRKGEGYRYDIDVLYNAIHDFTGDKNRIEAGRKAMIVIRSEK